MMKRTRLLVLAGTAAALIVGVAAPQPTAAACVADPYMGSVCWTAANFCPRQYAPADGALLTISGNEALFSLLGCTYGGDCRNIFGLPDLRGRSAVGSGVGPGLNPVSLGQMRGLEEVTLDVTEMPAHDHGATLEIDNGLTVSTTVEATLVPGNTGVDTGNVLASGGNPGNYFANPPQGSTRELGGVETTLSGAIGGTVTVEPNGSSQPHYNLPPQLGLTACIAVEGMYPPRN